MLLLLLLLILTWTHRYNAVRGHKKSAEALVGRSGKPLEQKKKEKKKGAGKHDGAFHPAAHETEDCILLWTHHTSDHIGESESPNFWRLHKKGEAPFGVSPVLAVCCTEKKAYLFLGFWPKKSTTVINIVPKKGSPFFSAFFLFSTQKVGDSYKYRTKKGIPFFFFFFLAFDPKVDDSYKYRTKKRYTVPKKVYLLWKIFFFYGFWPKSRRQSQKSCGASSYIVAAILSSERRTSGMNSLTRVRTSGGRTPSFAMSSI